MKTKYKLILVLFIGTVVSSCTEFLEENDKASLSSTDLIYNNNAEQQESLVASCYSYLRLWYGKEDGLTLSEGGTDIFLNARDNTSSLPFSTYNGLTPDETSFPLDQVWEYLWNAVNVCNTAEYYVGKSNKLTISRQIQLLSEIRFLRAFYYWHLVETWGPVPLKTAPTTETSTVVNRNSEIEVYQQMFKDIQYGISNMNKSVVPSSRVSYLAAKAFKARLALYFASEYNQTTYYDTAAIEAKSVIDLGKAMGKDFYSKYSDVWDIKKSTTSLNNEFIWAVDYYNTIGATDPNNSLPLRLQGNGQWNGMIQRQPYTTAGNGNCQHLWWTPRWNFLSTAIGGPAVNDVLVRHSGTGNENIAYKSTKTGNDTSSVQSFTVGSFYLKYAMGYVRYAPSRYLLELFDETKDQRFDVTFRTAWYKHPQVAPTNWPGFPGRVCRYPKMSMFTDFDTAAYISKRPLTSSQKDWVSGRYKAIDIDTLFRADGNYRLVGSDGSSDHFYPMLRKFENTDSKLGEVNATQFNDYYSYRDFPIFRISEMYLIAAEAQLTSNPADALTMINTLRQARALPGKASEMALANVDLTKILEERALEFCGEDIRWFDLKRTKRLKDQLQYNPNALSYFDETKHYLRPIPTIQMQSVTNKSQVPGTGFWQNPGY